MELLLGGYRQRSCTVSRIRSGYSPAPAVPHYASSSSLGRAQSSDRASEFPDEGLDEFLTCLKEAVEELGVGHPELIHLVWPYRQYISGDDGLAALMPQFEQMEACSETAPSDDQP